MTRKTRTPALAGDRGSESAFAGKRGTSEHTTPTFPTSRRKRGWPMVRACVLSPDGPRIVTVTGQTARALLALVAAGPKGRTALEVSSWALRFAAYCHVLRRDCGLNIVTEHEDHDTGWHGRHVLMDRVRILAVVEG